MMLGNVRYRYLNSSARSLTCSLITRGTFLTIAWPLWHTAAYTVKAYTPTNGVRKILFTVQFYMSPIKGQMQEMCSGW